MKLKCNACGKILFRDGRLAAVKSDATKRGYRTYCLRKDKLVYAKPVKKRRD